MPVKSKKKLIKDAKEAPSRSAPSTPLTQASSASEAYQVSHRDCVKRSLYEEHAQALQQLTLAGQQEVNNLQQEMQMQQVVVDAKTEELRRLRLDLTKYQENIEVLDIMSSQFAEMAVGPTYLQRKGYHNAEMYEYARRLWDHRQELMAVERGQEALQLESEEAAAMKSAISSPSPRHATRVKKQSKPSRSPSQTRSG